MPLSKIKEEYKSKVVIFGKNRTTSNRKETLSQRDDIDDLAIIALESGDKSLVRLFESPMPSLADLKKAKTDSQLPKFAEQKQPASPKKAAPSKGGQTSNDKN